MRTITPDVEGGSSHGVLDLTGGECNRVDNTHPDTLAQTFYLRPVAVCHCHIPL